MFPLLPLDALELAVPGRSNDRDGSGRKSILPPSDSFRLGNAFRAADGLRPESNGPGAILFIRCMTLPACFSGLGGESCPLCSPKPP